jgi:uncharacterized protein YegP (UPF0339 family)
MPGTFAVEQRDNGEFQFNLLAANGQVILTSEGYQAKQSCLDGVESVRTNSQDDARYARQTASDGRPYFNLTAPNGQVIGSSQMYSDEAACAAGISSVREHAPGAALDDRTG